jgi:hypothetical protein
MTVKEARRRPPEEARMDLHGQIALVTGTVCDFGDRGDAAESGRFNPRAPGATGSAAVPLALDHARTSGRVSKGDRVMLLAIEASKWKYAGMVLPWTADPLTRPALRDEEAVA